MTTVRAAGALGYAIKNALDPATRPSRAAFARNEIKNFLRAKVQENRQRIERAKYTEPDASDLP